ncbi:MAG: F-type H+-transporting ATPase subunit gamma [Hyphomicrobiaceae bacterium]
MANLKDIRKRISSVRNTQQITKAMKMVSAAKLRRAQDAAESARPYAEKLGELLSNVGSRVGSDAHPLLREGSDGPAHVIVIASDRGLCGGYNTNVIKLAESFLTSDEGKDATVVCCGRRGHDHFKTRIADRITAEHVNRPGGFDLALAREVTADATARFLDGSAGAVYLVYARFKSAMLQVPTVERLLPVAANEEETTDTETNADYLYEPDAASLLGSLLSRYVETKVFQAMLEATASEHGARMAAMDSATRNASEMIDRLTLQMNRARQAAITTELMEIISGAEALNG